jgi:hypothetical protein
MLLLVSISAREILSIPWLLQQSCHQNHQQDHWHRQLLIA